MEVWHSIWLSKEKIEIDRSSFTFFDFIFEFPFAFSYFRNLNREGRSFYVNISTFEWFFWRFNCSLFPFSAVNSFVFTIIWLHLLKSTHSSLFSLQRYYLSKYLLLISIFCFVLLSKVKNLDWILCLHSFQKHQLNSVNQSIFLAKISKRMLRENINLRAMCNTVLLLYCMHFYGKRTLYFKPKMTKKGATVFFAFVPSNSWAHKDRMLSIWILKP